MLFHDFIPLQQATCKHLENYPFHWFLFVWHLIYVTDSNLGWNGQLYDYTRDFQPDLTLYLSSLTINLVICTNVMLGRA